MMEVTRAMEPWFTSDGRRCKALKSDWLSLKQSSHHSIIKENQSKLQYVVLSMQFEKHSRMEIEKWLHLPDSQTVLAI